MNFFLSYKKPFSFFFIGEKKKMKTKTVKIALEGFDSYLGMEKGCFTVKNERRQYTKVSAN